MLRLVFCLVLFGVVLTGAAFTDEVVDGTVQRSDGMYEYTKITVVDTFTDEFFTYWVGEAKGSRAALVVTHDLSLAAAFGDELVLLDRGRVVASGSPAEVLRPERIESVFAADVDVTRDAAGRPLVVALRSRIRYSAPRDGPRR